MPGGVDIQEIRGQIEIKNFEDTCTVTTLEGVSISRVSIPDGADRYIVSLNANPLLGTDGRQFSIVLTWEAKKDSASGEFAPLLDAKSGVFFKNHEKNGQLFLKFQFELINKDPAKNLLKTFTSIRRMAGGSNVGWGPAAIPTDKKYANNGFVTLQDVFNPDKGWLEEGTFRANILLKIYNKDQHQVPAAASVGSGPQFNLSKDLAALLSKGDHTDVIIKVKDEEIRAHSLILMARSSVFGAMFASPMLEAKARTVVINDLDFGAVKATITFMYTGHIDGDLLKPDGDALGILEAAHRYDVTSLVDLCVQSLIAHLDVATVSECLHVADLIGNTSLKTSCLNFVRLHISEVQATEKFAKFVATRPALLTELLASLFPPAKRQRTE